MKAVDFTSARVLMVLKKHWRRLALLALAGLATIAILSTTLLASARPKPAFYLPPQGEVIVYFAPNPSSGVSGLPVSLDELKRNGVTPVYAFNQLKNLGGADPNIADAIILHESRVGEVDRAWIQDIYQLEMVIAGVNITMHELAELVGDQRVLQDPAWAEGWQKEPFFSILYFKPAGRAEERQKAQAEGLYLGFGGGSTDNIRQPGDVDTFLSLIRRDIAELRQASPVPTPEDNR